VLLIAEAANPEWTSVPLIGWSLSRALSKVADVHLVTQVRNRSAFIRAGLVEGRDFTAIDNEDVAAPMFKISEMLRGGSGKGWTTTAAFSSLAYYSFEKTVWEQFKARLMDHEFDLVHRITPVSPTSPSIIAKRLDALKVPFVLGPLNGGVPWPKAFRARQYAEKEWLSHIRWLYKMMPAYRSTRKFSAAILTGSKHTYEEMPEWAKAKCVHIPENGVDPGRFGNPQVRRVSQALQGAFVGRLVPYKGADILLQAAADFLRAGQLELNIIGDGPQRSCLEDLADQLNVRNRVRFHGWVAHTQIQDTLGSCDFLALPSIREFGGGVVLEAMALGVPPIVADYGGPSELVDDKTGIRVSFRDSQSLVDGMRLAFESVIRSPEHLICLGKAARQKVAEKYTWEAKANQIVRVYEAVLSGKKNLNSLSVQ
jgi:glycosyltransferase involved in cell wall biosynthesis